ncbi:glycosyltransferase [Mariniradius sediminis]|uniref:Glycosyltransferase n=1 Tax=Mariniradius sediminis TaxID=2909237 RepID=A0ABS9BR52_9BACT|nr:glycosyltransferase [Mariniradius sediminis]MCF1749967.1 glycosyltransferase [Mariniradius sediminis]
MLSFYLFFGILYALLLRGLGKLWGDMASGLPRPKGVTDVSIVVAYRNEATNLGALLDSVLKLTHRPLELIMLDDHSDDGGAGLVDDYREVFLESEIHLVSVAAESHGKKAAIAQGVEMASGDIILTTDADCAFPTEWVEGMLGPFSQAEVHLVAGPVISSGQSSFFDRFQQIEWASILLVTQAGFSLGNPIMCSAANMAFRKSSFLQVNGFEGNTHIPTGDDEFLLKKTVRQFGAVSARYMNSRNVLVKTRPQAKWSEMFSQRIRWASKWNMHGSIVHMLAAVFPAIIQLAWVGSLVLLFQGWKGILVLFFIWFLKIWYEKLALGKVLKSYSILNPALSFWVTSIIHPWYVLGAAIGTLFLNYTWKDRKYGRKQ